MERLTEWNKSSYKHAYYPRCFEEPCYGNGCKIKDCPFETAVCERLASYEDSGLTPEELKAPFTEDAMINLAAQALGVEPSRLRELAEADKDGRVVVPPCRQGDELWTYCNHPVKRVYSFTVSDVSTLNGRTVLNTLGLGTIRPEDIGKTVFLTREEAEKALQEMEGKA
jgi:hypothetical protein|nr:MAG TPA: hypothetical protein [Caudoviricetes sp.]